MVSRNKKAEVTLSKFLIAIVIISLFSVTIFTLIATFRDSYDNDIYDSNIENMSSFDKTSNVQGKLENASKQWKNLDTNNPLDVGGFILKGGVEIVRTMYESTDDVVDISEDSITLIKKDGEIENSNGTTLWKSLQTSITAIILILVLITIVLAILTGRRT